MPRVALLANPESGQGEAGSVEEALREGGAEVSTFPLGDLDSALATRPDRIVVAGGDGSIGCVAAGAARANVPLAVVPTGTANDFAAAMELPTDVREAAALAATGTQTRRMELGWAGSHPFVNLASLGLSPIAAERAHGLKSRLGALAYPVGALSAGLTARPVRCRVECRGGRRFEGEAWQVSIACTGFFGGGASLDTDAEDGRLDVVVIEGGSRLRLVKHAWGMRVGRIESHRRVRDDRCERVDLRLAASETLNVDGELVEAAELIDEGRIEFRAESDAYELIVG